MLCVRLASQKSDDPGAFDPGLNCDVNSHLLEASVRWVPHPAPQAKGGGSTKPTETTHRDSPRGALRPPPFAEVQRTGHPRDESLGYSHFVPPGRAPGTPGGVSLREHTRLAQTPTLLSALDYTEDLLSSEALLVDPTRQLLRDRALRILRVKLAIELPDHIGGNRSKGLVFEQAH